LTCKKNNTFNRTSVGLNINEVPNKNTQVKHSTYQSELNFLVFYIDMRSLRLQVEEPFLKRPNLVDIHSGPQKWKSKINVSSTPKKSCLSFAGNPGFQEFDTAIITIITIHINRGG